MKRVRIGVCRETTGKIKREINITLCIERRIDAR